MSERVCPCGERIELDVRSREEWIRCPACGATLMLPTRGRTGQRAGKSVRRQVLVLLVAVTAAIGGGVWLLMRAAAREESETDTTSRAVAAKLVGGPGGSTATPQPSPGISVTQTFVRDELPASRGRGKARARDGKRLFVVEARLSAEALRHVTEDAPPELMKGLDGLTYSIWLPHVRLQGATGADLAKATGVSEPDALEQYDLELVWTAGAKVDPDGSVLRRFVFAVDPTDEPRSLQVAKEPPVPLSAPAATSKPGARLAAGPLLEQAEARWAGARALELSSRLEMTLPTGKLAYDVRASFLGKANLFLEIPEGGDVPHTTAVSDGKSGRVRTGDETSMGGSGGATKGESLRVAMFRLGGLVPRLTGVDLIYRKYREALVVSDAADSGDEVVEGTTYRVIRYTIDTSGLVPPPAVGSSSWA